MEIGGDDIVGEMLCNGKDAATIGTVSGPLARSSARMGSDVVKKLESASLETTTSLTSDELSNVGVRLAGC